MEDQFYSRATGKLKKTASNAYLQNPESKKDASSIYSLEDNKDDFAQYPMGTLSPSQTKYIHNFVNGISKSPTHVIDPDIRAIHMIGSWQSENRSLTISCSLIQPHIIGGTVGLSGVLYKDAQRYAEMYFPSEISGSPSIIKTLKYCQLMGMYAIPFADKLISEGIVKSNRVSFNLVVLSKTQPIFTVVNDDAAYECKLTHMSCRIMADVLPQTATVSYPTSSGHNFSFRCSALRAGGGTGPPITIHTSGVMQYQGRPESIGQVASSFKDCIDTAMHSSRCMKFIRSLAILRKIHMP